MENEDGHAVNYTTSLCNWLLSNSVKRVKSSNGDAGMSSANGSAVSTASAASLADADAAPPPPPPLPPGWVVLPQALLEQQAPHSYEKHTVEKHTVRTGTGATGEGIGNKAARAWEGVKEAIPGTKEHAAIHPGSGTSGLGAVGAGTGMGTGMGAATTHSSAAGAAGTAKPHAATNPATGQTHLHSTSTGAAVDQAWQDVKTKIPGTKEHNITNTKVWDSLKEGLSTTLGGAAMGADPASGETYERSADTGDKVGQPPFHAYEPRTATDAINAAEDKAAQVWQEVQGKGR
ncbi:hypothetical protein C2E20_8603 [Micractinium conductrix]|uniref:Uncharacterized protein n=1 Tax=Micractinium conductrix TaxID=554055 RepID=A0A2P6V0Z2_9CHLO|nr:hypothetical protein C2E20_8603 [Micractinium conductrix]|eukprot:PSC67758.1 hypothetical protein C2E20_8603 [Micractinium conductrix]